MSNTFYVYRDYSKKCSLIYTTFAESILEADKKAKEDGFNPLRLVTCFGAYVVFKDPTKIENKLIWTSPKTGEKEYILTDGIILKSKNFDTISECQNFIDSNESFRTTGVIVSVLYAGGDEVIFIHKGF